MRRARTALIAACLPALLAAAAPADARKVFRPTLDVTIEGTIVERWSHQPEPWGTCRTQEATSGEATIRFRVPRSRMLFSARDFALHGHPLAELSVDRTGTRTIAHTGPSTDVDDCSQPAVDYSGLDPSTCGHRDVKTRVAFLTGPAFRFGLEPGAERRAFPFSCPYPDSPSEIAEDFFGTTSLIGIRSLGSRDNWFVKQFGTCNPRPPHCTTGRRTVTIHNRRQLQLPYQPEGSYSAEIEWTAKTTVVKKFARR